MDDAESLSEAETWVKKMTHFLDISYSDNPALKGNLSSFIRATFPPKFHGSFELLATDYLPSKPLYSLLDGFRTDLKFDRSVNSAHRDFPIANDDDLHIYCAQVASTISTLCLAVVSHHLGKNNISAACLAAGADMGLALQLVNIARDISVDTTLGRVYIPTDWLAVCSLKPDDVIASAGTLPEIEEIRRRLLARAMSIYSQSRWYINELPAEARAPVRVMVDSYMEIGVVMLERMDAGVDIKRGGQKKATVPIWRRLSVVWSALRD